MMEKQESWGGVYFYSTPLLRTARAAPLLACAPASILMLAVSFFEIVTLY